MNAIVGPHGETAFFSEPLLHLAEHDPRFTGIYIPESEFGVTARGITSQFLDSAELYHAKYTSDERSHARRLEYEALLQPYGYVPGSALTILDIGAGSGGNTVLPLAQMFPKSIYVATDLSPNLLAILNGVVRGEKLDCELLCVSTDAAKTPMQDETFDLVVGSSILHHLIDPRPALERVYKVLKPGGVAVFFEPFEKGHAIVSLVFKQILRAARAGATLDPRVEKVFHDMLLDWSVRVGRDKSAEFYQHLDDKWLFTENYLNETGVEIGFEALSMMRRPPKPRRFEEFVANVLILHSSLPRSQMPDWAWSIVREVDETLSADLSADLRIEDWFALRKPHAAI